MRCVAKKLRKELTSVMNRRMNHTEHTIIHDSTEAFLHPTPYSIIPNPCEHSSASIGGWIMSHICRTHVTNLKKSCHTCEGVMSHIWKSHITYMKESCHACGKFTSRVSTSCITYMSGSCTSEWVMSRRVTHLNGPCHIYDWVTSHIWLSYFTRMIESCHTCEGIISHIWMGHATHLNESRHSCEWVMSHTCMGLRHTYKRVTLHEWMSHGTHMHRPCHTYEWVTMSHVWTSHVPQEFRKELKSIIDQLSDGIYRSLVNAESAECWVGAHFQSFWCNFPRHFDACLVKYVCRWSTLKV